MATQVFIDGSESRAKIRNPWAVLGLSIVTLSVYSVFWWYYINREMRDLGAARRVSGLGDTPALSAVAWASGWLFYVPLIWTIVTTSQRIHRTQGIAAVSDRINGWIAALLWIVTLGLGGMVYTQYQLNKVWETQDQVPPSLPPDSTGTISDLETTST